MRATASPLVVPLGGARNAVLDARPTTDVVRAAINEPAAAFLHGT